MTVTIEELIQEIVKCNDVRTLEAVQDYIVKLQLRKL